jgi:hypothetical protein
MTTEKPERPHALSNEELELLALDERDLPAPPDFADHEGALYGDEDEG